jgi:hypothetical protein
MKVEGTLPAAHKTHPSGELSEAFMLTSHNGASLAALSNMHVLSCCRFQRCTKKSTSKGRYAAIGSLV